MTIEKRLKAKGVTQVELDELKKKLEAEQANKVKRAFTRMVKQVKGER